MTYTSIYQEHDAKFSGITAAVILHNGKRVGTVTMTHKTAVTAYVHFHGLQMQKGRATGGGYDRATAAAASAARKIKLDGGTHWDRALENAGFTVYRAV